MALLNVILYEELIFMKKEDLERNICEKGDFTQKDVKKFIKIFW